LRKNGLETIENRHTCKHRVNELFSIYQRVQQIGIQQPGAPDVADDIEKEIAQLIIYFSFQLDLYCAADPCDNNEDPYSFRTTVVFPCWPKRFRNKSFRKYVEKVIYSETPAHVKANIFWLGITEMRNYEEPYFNWLIEMAGNDVPDIGICNDLIKQLRTLKNCDEDCMDADEPHKTGTIVPVPKDPPVAPVPVVAPKPAVPTKRQK